MKLLASAGLGAILSLLVMHSASAQWQGKAGAAIRGVSHTEDDRAGRRLVRETGWLPGVGLDTAYTSGSLTWFGAAEWYRGTIGYCGQTQAGVGAASTTTTGLGALRLGVRYTIDGYSVIAAAEADLWKRDIRSTASSVGLQERYRSERLITGVSKAWQLPGAVVAADFTVLFVTPERVRVGFSDLLDTASLETKRARGIRIGAHYRPAFAPSLELRASFDWIRTARSEDAPVTRNGQFAGTIAQPEHAREALTLGVSTLF